MGTVLASLQHFFARLWFVLKLAFGPAKGAARSWGSWWPTAVAILTVIAGFAGVSIPKHVSAGWVAAGVLAVIAFLFARAAYKLHAERDRPFPDVEVVAGGVVHTHPTDFFHHLSIPTRVTNRGPEDVSLSFLLFFQHGPNPERPVACSSASPEYSILSYAPRCGVVTDSAKAFEYRRQDRRRKVSGVHVVHGLGSVEVGQCA
jgi:hypothetical protein